VKTLKLPLQIDRFTLVTWALPPGRLAALLPPSLALETVTIPGHGERALLSIFAGRVRLSAARLPLAAITQLNYRTYIRRGSDSGIFFLRSLVSSLPVAVAARVAAGFPAHASRLAVRWGPAGAAEVAGDEAELALARGYSPHRLAGFPSLAEGLEKLLRPLWGYWLRADGRLGVMRVEHPTPAPLTGRLSAARLPWLVERGVLSAEEAAAPHSVLFVPRLKMGAYLAREIVTGERPAAPA
jgi:uncharacterized protein YqjF (DUF2071 family)